MSPVRMVAVTAGGIELTSLRNRFEQRRFSAPILTGEEGHEVFKL